ncbi:MAG: hypothetical protein RL196_878, partial [Actinomycetota bacterium]
MGWVLFRFGVFSRLVSTVLLTSLVASGLVPVFGVGAANAAGSVAQGFVADDFLSAQVRAKQLQHRILVSGELTEVSTSWVNVDGT